MQVTLFVTTQEVPSSDISTFKLGEKKHIKIKTPVVIPLFSLPISILANNSDLWISHLFEGVSMVCPSLLPNKAQKSFDTLDEMTSF